MSSYRQILYHIIFRTKNSRKTIVLEHSDELYAYIRGIVKNKGCHLYEINGMQEHIHIILDLHPSIALADLMRDLKASSSMWLKQNPKFPDFTGWAGGYGAFTYAYGDIGRVRKYVQNQRVHHKAKDFLEEYRRLLSEHHITIDERYFP